jgi:ABC-type branched-subunit amino acid transport system substrate-binding protein
LKALAWHPSVIIGLDNPSVLVPLEHKFANSPVPILAQFIDPSFQQLKQPNSLFSVRGPYWTAAGATTAWMIQHFHAKSVGLICDDNAYGTNSCDSDAKSITAASATLVKRVVSPITSTDESTEAQAMLGSDIVSDEGYPAVIQLDVKSMDAEGLNVPVSAGGSLAYTTGGLSASVLSQLYGYADCVPAAWTSTLGKYVESTFLKKYGSPLGGYTAHLWDSILMAAQASKNAGSQNPVAIKKQLRKINFKGVCSDYYSGPFQNMVHSVDVIQPITDTTFKVLEAVKLANN